MPVYESACKLISLHLKPFLQNIVYPEAINEIQTLTDAYIAEQLQETGVTNRGHGTAATEGLAPDDSDRLA